MDTGKGMYDCITYRKAGFDTLVEFIGKLLGFDDYVSECGWAIWSRSSLTSITDMVLEDVTEVFVTLDLQMTCY
jgi:hypothetical protein